MKYCLKTIQYGKAHKNFFNYAISIYEVFSNMQGVLKHH